MGVVSGTFVIFTIPWIGVSSLSIKIDKRARVGIAPYSAAVHVVKIATDVGMKELALRFEFPHSLRHIEEPVQIDWAVGIVVGLSGISVFGELQPLRIQPTPMTLGLR